MKLIFSDIFSFVSFPPPMAPGVHSSVANRTRGCVREGRRSRLHQSPAPLGKVPLLNIPAEGAPISGKLAGKGFRTRGGKGPAEIHLSSFFKPQIGVGRGIGFLLNNLAACIHRHVHLCAFLCIHWAQSVRKRRFARRGNRAGDRTQETGLNPQTHAPPPWGFLPPLLGITWRPFRRAREPRGPTGKSPHAQGEPVGSPTPMQTSHLPGVAPAPGVPCEGLTRRECHLTCLDL